jgi:hypothetical protein
MLLDTNEEYVSFTVITKCELKKYFRLAEGQLAEAVICTTEAHYPIPPIPVKAIRLGD